MFVSFVVYISGLCNGLITFSKEVCVCLTVHDLESSIMMQPRSNLGSSITESYIYFDR